MFLTVIQNNSGGYFVENDDVAQYVIIECDNINEAIRKFDQLDNHKYEMCPCCGDRWSIEWMDETDLTKKPEIYGEPAKDYKTDYYYVDKSIRHHIIIHYKNGKKERINIPPKREGQ